MQLVFQNLTEWLQEVPVQTMDCSWNQGIVQIILYKDGQKHPPMASAPAILKMLWVWSHNVSSGDGLLYLDLLKQDTKQDKNMSGQI